MIHVAEILSHEHTYAVSELMVRFSHNEFFSHFSAPTCFQLKLNNSAALRPLCLDLFSTPYFSYLTFHSTKIKQPVYYLRSYSFYLFLIKTIQPTFSLQMCASLHSPPVVLHVSNEKLPFP